MSDSFYQRALDEAPEALVHLSWNNAKSKNLAAMRSILEVLEANLTLPMLTCVKVEAVAVKGTGNQNVSIADAMAQALSPLNAEDLHHEVLWTAEQRGIFDRFLVIANFDFEAQKDLKLQIDPLVLFFNAASLVVQDPAFFDGMEKPHKMAPLGVLSRAGKVANTTALIAMLKDANDATVRDFVSSLVPDDREITNESSAAIDALAKLVGDRQTKKGGLIDLLDCLDEQLKLADGESSTAHVRADLLRRRLDRLSEPMDVDALKVAAQLLGKGGLDPSACVLREEVSRHTAIDRLFGDPDAKQSTIDNNVMVSLLEAAVRRRCPPVIDLVLPVLKRRAAGVHNMVAMALQHNGPVSMDDIRGTMQRMKDQGVSLEHIRGADKKIVRQSAMAQLVSMGPHAGDEQKLAALLDVGIDTTPAAFKGVKFTDDAHKHRLMSVVKAHGARRTAHELLADLDAPAKPHSAP